MARLPYVEPDSAPTPIRSVLSEHPVSVLRMLAHAESAFTPWVEYTSTLLSGLELDPILRELAILQVTHTSNSELPWVQHVAIARAVGVRPEQIAAIEEDRAEDAGLTEEQRLVLSFAREVVLDGSAQEPAVAELTRLLGPRQVVELLLVIGQWLAIACLIATTGMQPDLPAMANAMPEGLRGPLPPPASRAL